MPSQVLGVFAMMNARTIARTAAMRNGSLTVRDVADAYLAHVALRHRLGGYTAASKERAEYYLTSFVALFGKKPVAACVPPDLTRWLLEHPTWESDFTKHDAMTAVLSAFRWAADEARIIPANPYRKPKDLRFRLRPRSEFTAEDYRALMDRARNVPGRRKCPSSFQFRCVCYFLWRSGARTCESRQTLWQDLDWDGGVICLTHHKTADATGQDRMIGLDDRLLRFLRWLWNRHQVDPSPCRCKLAKDRPHAVEDHVFLNSRDKPWSKDSFARLFRAFANRAGISRKKTAYSLRHGFTVRSIEAHCSDREVADALGHTSTRYVAWYGRATRQKTAHLRGVANRANGRKNSST